MNKVDKIRKINNKIVSKNKIDSFERQLINLMNGLYDMNYPMIISNNTKCLNYIDEIDENKILIINPYKVIKINNEHEIGSSFIMNIYSDIFIFLYKNRIFCFLSPCFNIRRQKITMRLLIFNNCCFHSVLHSFILTPYVVINVE